MMPLTRTDRTTRITGPAAARAERRAPRLRRALLAACVTAAVALPLVGAARPAEVPAPAPPPLPALTTTSPRDLAAQLDARYAATRTAVTAAERTADTHGAHQRARALHTMAGPGRHFLAFDGRDGGRAAEVVGDLARADRIAVLVPGADTDLDRYARFRSGARALHHALRPTPRDSLPTPATSGTGTPAVIGWLGYRTPATGSAASLTTGRAEQAAPALRAFVTELRRIRPDARITLLCHSYGSVVCARAAAGTPADAIVLYGSPGTGFDDAAGLRTRAAVWAGRADGDWIGGVPHLRLPLPPFTTGPGELGFGTDPVDPAFGARRFAAGGGGHSDYLAPGSVPLRNLARIVTGRQPTDSSDRPPADAAGRQPVDATGRESADVTGREPTDA
ncbi:alpha/beta hydrolase [Streptomyces sp. NPDC090025]|uniref:alpha/beta hydrolase n=1 Tax=Streptomyces sp. NPDC090025 TaxID=3365922 RepID=UPI003839B9C9